MNKSLGLLLVLGAIVLQAELGHRSAAQEQRGARYEPAVGAASSEGELAIKGFRKPPGVHVELFAAEPHVANVVAFAFDDLGRLFVAETFRHGQGVTDIRGHMDWLDDDLASRTVEERVEMYRKRMSPEEFAGFGREHDRVRRVVDLDSDGTADAATVFADGFSDQAVGIGAGVLPWRGDVFYACIPDLWRLRDTRGTGTADQRERLHHGYGLHVGFIGHDLHGLMIGPDGKLYFSIGDRGLNVTETPDGRHVSSPDSGAVLRCDLDGRNLEIVATGLRNPQELAFTAEGDLFTVDNNSDSGDRARLVHVVEGGDSGWRIGYQFIERPNSRGPWNSEAIWDASRPASEKPAYVVPPLANFSDGPSGLVYHPGIARLPDELRGHFFLADFRGAPGSSGVRVFRIKPHGASFELAEEREYLWGFEATDVDFGTDGSLYVSDWVEGWDRTGKGRIYRVADPSKAEDPAVRELPKLLAEDFETLPVPELVSRLGHADYRIRLRAQLALDSQSRRDEPTGDEARAALSATAEAGSSLDARRHAIWGLGMALTRSAVSPDQLCKLLEDRDPEIRAQTARVLGWGSRTDEHQMILAALVRRLEDESPRVAFHAALSLGKLRATGSGPALARMLEANTDRDPYLRHAGVMGLVGTATDDELKALAAHRSFSVRLGSLLAMRRRLLPEVARFLADPEPKLVAEAARAIHDVPIERAMGELADLGRRPELKDEAVLRRVVGACSRVDTEESAAILAEIAAEPAKPRSIRVEALEVLGQWAKPSGRDLVTGLWRPIPERKPDAAARALAPKIEGLLSEPSENLVRAGIAAAANLHLKEAGKALGALVTTRGRIESTRAEALAAAVALEPPELLATLRAALKSDASGVRAEALRLMAARAPEEALVTIEQVLENGTVAEKQAAFTTLGDLHAAGSDGVLALWMDRLHAGRLQPELELDLLDAARSRKDQEIQGKLDRHEKSRPAGDSLVPYREVLVGGNFARGRRIFFEKAEVYCLRCHKVGGQGGEVGPELTGIARKKDRSYLLRSLVQPNHEIAEGFETLVVATSDGQIQAGVVKGEDDRVIRLMTPEAKLVEIAKDQVEETKRGASAMPEDLVSKLSRKELRDLLEYLGRLR